MKYLDGVPDDEINKITHLNAMRHFQFDPFSRPAPGAVHGRRAAGRGHRRRHLAGLAGPRAHEDERRRHRERQQLRDPSRKIDGQDEA